MIDPSEKAAADYLLSLSKDERAAAAGRVNQLVVAQAPPEDSERQLPVRTLGEYLAEKIETPPFLVSNGQLVRGELTVMVARAGKGKTTIGMNRMIRWSAGLPLFDGLDDNQAPTQPLRILMIENEGVASFMQEKLALLVDRGADFNEEQKELAKKNMMVWGDGGYSGLKIDREQDLNDLKRACELYAPDAILLEPFRGIWRGEENDSTAMESVLDDLVGLGHEFGAAIMLSHHERKSGAGEDGEWMSAARGSGDLEGKAAVMENWRGVKGNLYRELSWSKSRFAPASAPIRMIFNHVTWRYELVAEDGTRVDVLGMMSEDPDSWFWVDEIAEALNESKRVIRDAMNKLLEEERVVRKKGTDERRGYRFRLKQGDDSGSGGLEIA